MSDEASVGMVAGMAAERSEQAEQQADAAAARAEGAEALADMAASSAGEARQEAAQAADVATSTRYDLDDFRASVDSRFDAMGQVLGKIADHIQGGTKTGNGPAAPEPKAAAPTPPPADPPADPAATGGESSKPKGGKGYGAGWFFGRGGDDD